MSERKTMFSIPPVAQWSMSGSLIAGALTTLLPILVAGVWWIATFKADTVSKPQMTAAIDKHAETPHRAADKRITTMEARQVALGKSMAYVKADVEQVHVGQEYIKARLDFLIEREVVKANTNPESRVTSRRAAKRVRERARKTEGRYHHDDPLEGVDF